MARSFAYHSIATLRSAGAISLRTSIRLAESYLLGCTSCRIAVRVNHIPPLDEPVRRAAHDQEAHSIQPDYRVPFGRLVLTCGAAIRRRATRGRVRQGHSSLTGQVHV
jgi:hypothetical protein